MCEGQPLNQRQPQGEVHRGRLPSCVQHGTARRTRQDCTAEYLPTLEHATQVRWCTGFLLLVYQSCLELIAHFTAIHTPDQSIWKLEHEPIRVHITHRTENLHAGHKIFAMQPLRSCGLHRNGCRMLNSIGTMIATSGSNGLAEESIIMRLANNCSVLKRSQDGASTTRESSRRIHIPKRTQAPSVDVLRRPRTPRTKYCFPLPHFSHNCRAHGCGGRGRPSRRLRIGPVKVYAPMPRGWQ